MYSSNKIQLLGVNNYTGTTAASYDIVVTDKTGGAVGAGESLLFKQKLADGSFQTLALIDKAQVKSVSAKAAVTPVPAYATVQAVASATGDLHRIEVALDNWGSDSFEDQYIKQGNYEEAASDTALKIGLGLVSSLYKNYSREVPVQSTMFIQPTDGFDAMTTSTTTNDMWYSIAAGTWYVYNGSAQKDIASAVEISSLSGMTTGNLYIIKATSTTGTLYLATGATTATTISTVVYHKQNPLFVFLTTKTGLVYIIEKDQAFVVGKLQSKPLIFKVSGKVYDVSNAYVETVLTTTHVGAVKNPVDAKSMASLEWFCAGYSGDDYRGVNYPNNFEYSGLVNTATSYATIYTINYDLEGIGFNKGAVVSNTLHILCASAPGTANTVADILENAIYTAWSIDVRTSNS